MPKVVKPVDAAGLVLIRAASKGVPEILLGRRHRRAGFLPDIYVVPGGRVDPADSAASGFTEDLNPGQRIESVTIVNPPLIWSGVGAADTPRSAAPQSSKKDDDSI